MTPMKCVVGVGLIVAMMVPPAFAQSGQAGQITTLLTPQERAAAGLSKLSASELAALDAALLRVFGELAGLLTSTASAAERAGISPSDPDLFDSRGRAAAFLQPSDGLTLYLWSGEPVAYLDDDSVYGFNGKHLGWYRDGTVYDHEGNIVVAPASRFGRGVQSPPPRGLGGLNPLKGLRELRPLRPLCGVRWSRLPAAVFFLRGID